jgi:hypothetical protein
MVAGQGDLVTAAQGRAVDRGDDRLAEGLDAAQVALDGEAAVEEVLRGLGGDAEVMMTPRMVSFSASRRSVITARESRNAWFMVLADWFGSSMTRVTTPVRSCSQRMVVD